MFFEGIGRISAYVDLCKTRYKANYRIRTGKTFAETYGLKEHLLPTYEESKKRVNTYRLESIKQRLSQGKELSADELRFLKENAPKLYRKALVVDEARRDLRIDLSRAKTKDDARQAMMRAISRVGTAQATDVSNLGGDAGANLSMGSSSPDQIAMPSGEGDASLDASASFADGTTSASASAEVMTGEKAVPSQKDGGIASTRSSLLNTMTKAEKLRAVVSMKSQIDSQKNIFSENLQLMLIRALHDEWQQFLESGDYEELPTDITDKNVLRRKGSRRTRRATPYLYGVYKDVVADITPKKTHAHKNLHKMTLAKDKKSDMLSIKA